MQYYETPTQCRHTLALSDAVDNVLPKHLNFTDPVHAGVRVLAIGHNASKNGAKLNSPKQITSKKSITQFNLERFHNTWITCLPRCFVPKATLVPTNPYRTTVQITK